MAEPVLPEVFREIYLLIKLHWQSSNGGDAGDPPEDLPIFNEIYDFTAQTLIDRVAAQLRDPSTWRPQDIRCTGQDIGMASTVVPTSPPATPPASRADHATWFPRHTSGTDDSSDDAGRRFGKVWKRRVSYQKRRENILKTTNNRYSSSKIDKHKKQASLKTYSGQRRSKRLKTKKQAFKPPVT